MNNLTEEQRRRMEENRLKALEKRAASVARAASIPSSVTTVSSSSLNLNRQNNPVRPPMPANVSTKQIGKPSSSAPPPFAGNKMGKVLTGTCVMISRDRFKVEIGFHDKLKDVFKSIMGHAYDSYSKRWNFPISQYSNLITAVSSLRPAVCIGPLPAFVLRVFKNIVPGSSRTIPSQDLSRIDSVLVNALMPFQADGVMFGISKNGRCLIADEMGLGKSIQALGIAHYYYNEWPLLITCPSSMRYAWRESIWRWLPSVNPGSIFVVETGKDDLDNWKVLITSYDLLQKRAEDFSHCKVVIMDESHHLKNYKTARTKAAIPIMQNSKRLIMLSGTPALSRPMELYTQISAINRNLFSSYDDYGIRYCNGIKNAWGWDFSGSSNMEELQLLLEETVMIRRLKSEVMQQLPSKFRKIAVLDPLLVRCKNNKSLAATAAAFNTVNSRKATKPNEKRGKLLEYYAETASAKLDAVKAYLTELVKTKRKFICFSHHKIMMDGISEELEKLKTPYVRIDGSTCAEDRQAAVDVFQTRSDVLAAVLSLTAANSGITLTAASLVIFAELYWNPGILVQAEDRAHRISQAEPVSVEYLVARGTADDVLWEMIKQKLDVLNKAGLSKDDFGNAGATTLQQNGGSQEKQPKIDMFFSSQSSQNSDSGEDDVALRECEELASDPALLDELLDESFY